MFGQSLLRYCDYSTRVDRVGNVKKFNFAPEGVKISTRPFALT